MSSLRFVVLLVLAVVLCTMSLCVYSAAASKSDDSPVDSLEDLVVESAADADADAAQSQLSPEQISEMLWDRYKYHLMLFLRRSEGVAADAEPSQAIGLQMVPMPLFANWHESQGVLPLLANQVPSQWSDIYRDESSSSGTAYSLPHQYSKFLDNLKLQPYQMPSVDDMSAMASLDMRLMTTLFQLQTDRLGCLQMWNEYKELDPASCPAYNVDFESMFCPAVSLQEQQIRYMKGEMVELQQRMMGPQSDALSALADLIGDQTHHGWREWTGNTLQSFVDKCKQGACPGAGRFSVSFDAGSSVKEVRTWTKKKKSGFIFKKTKTETREEMRMTSSNFGMQITAQGYTIIPVTPAGSWFNANIVHKYRQSPATQWKNPLAKFFGPSNGSMSLIVKSFHVVYKPKVTLFVNRQDGEYFMSHKTSSFSIGPFGGYQSTNQMRVEKISSDQYKVELDSSSSDDVMILAIDHHVVA